LLLRISKKPLPRTGESKRKISADLEKKGRGEEISGPIGAIVQEKR